MSTTIPIPVLRPNNVSANAKSIQITERALEKIRAAMAKDNLTPEQGGVRLGLQGGGCYGLTYDISFDGRARKHDRIYDFDGVRVFIDPKSFIYLHGMVLDYEESLMTHGFKVIDPNSSRSCGCGSSFPA